MNRAWPCGFTGTANLANFRRRFRPVRSSTMWPARMRKRKSPNVGWCSDATGWRLHIGNFPASVRRITGENRDSFDVGMLAAWQSTVRQFLPHRVDCNEARIRQPAMSTYLPHWYLSRFGPIGLRLPIHNGIGSHVVSTALAVYILRTKSGRWIQVTDLARVVFE